MLARPVGKTRGHFPSIAPSAPTGALTAHPLAPGRGAGGRWHLCPASAAVLVRGLENLPFPFSSDVPPEDFPAAQAGSHSLHGLPALLSFYLFSVQTVPSCVFTSYPQDCELLGGRN